MPMGFDLQTLVLAGTIISAVIAALYALASLVRNETEMHQLKLRVHQMRAEYLRRAREGIDAHNADPNADVDIVDTVPEPAQQRKAA
jgi:H+/gluconate symporter-like permease